MYHHVKKTHVRRKRRLSPTRVSEKFCSSSLAVRTANSPLRCNTPSKGWSCDDPERKDLLMDIGTEKAQPS